METHDDIAHECEIGDEDAAFEGIGLSDPDMAGFGFSGEDCIAHGKEWWRDREAQIRTLVCRGKHTDDLVQGSSRDLVAFVLPLIGANFGTAVASYVTVLAVRRMMKGWCRNRDDQDFT